MRGRGAAKWRPRHLRAAPRAASYRQGEPAGPEAGPSPPLRWGPSLPRCLLPSARPSLACSFSPPTPHSPVEARCSRSSPSAAAPARPQVPPPHDPRCRRRLLLGPHGGLPQARPADAAGPEGHGQPAPHQLHQGHDRGRFGVSGAGGASPERGCWGLSFSRPVSRTALSGGGWSTPRRGRAASTQGSRGHMPRVSRSPRGRAGGVPRDAPSGNGGGRGAERRGPGPAPPRAAALWPCRAGAGLSTKEFVPRAQTVSFSFRARQLEVILHRISSEPEWDYL